MKNIKTIFNKILRSKKLTVFQLGVLFLMGVYLSFSLIKFEAKSNELINAVTEKPRIEIKDNREKILHDYLASYNSPMVDEASNFIEAADKYGVDWKLVPSITGVESTFGKFVPGGSGDFSSHNGWGWGVYGTQAIYFHSWREGIFTVTEGLSKNYIAKGLTNPYAINRVYAASPTWGAHVSFFLADLTSFAKKYPTQVEQIKMEKLHRNESGQSAKPKLVALAN